MAERDPDPYVLYTVMRRSLGIHGGKIGAQCQHAFDYLTRAVEEMRERLRLGGHLSERDHLVLRDFDTWRATKEHAMVVLGATDDEFEQVKKENLDYYYLVIDLGFTQVSPNTETCLCLWPIRKSARSKLLQKLRPL